MTVREQWLCVLEVVMMQVGDLYEAIDRADTIGPHRSEGICTHLSAIMSAAIEAGGRTPSADWPSHSGDGTTCVTGYADTEMIEPQPSRATLVMADEPACGTTATSAIAMPPSVGVTCYLCGQRGTAMIHTPTGWMCDRCIRPSYGTSDTPSA